MRWRGRPLLLGLLALLLLAASVWLWLNGSVARIRSRFVPEMRRVEALRDGLDELRRAVREGEEARPGLVAASPVVRWASDDLREIALVEYDVLTARDLETAVEARVTFTVGGIARDGSRLERSAAVPVRVTLSGEGTLSSTALLACAAAVVPARAAKPYRAEHYHTRVVVEPGGSIAVTETIRFIFRQDEFTYVSRELPSRRMDGLTIVEASMDGIPMERVKAAGQFEVKRDDDRRRIVWHFPATSDAARTFTVTYWAAGVVWQDADSDGLAWTLLPTRHEYAIECASGEVAYPAGSALVADAVLDPSSSEVRHEGRTIRFERCPFGRNASWVVRLRFAPRSVAAVAPRWQRRAARNRETASGSREREQAEPSWSTL